VPPSLEAYIQKSNLDPSGVSVSLAARFLALKSFRNDVAEPPKNMGWIFLMLHRIIFERVATLHPEVTGLKQNESKQNVQEAINSDLQILCSAAEDVDITKGDLRARKVRLSKIHISLMSQRSANYFLDLCLSVTRSYMRDALHLPCDDRLSHATMIVSLLFRQYSRGTLGVFCSIGAWREEMRVQVFSRALWPTLRDNLEQFERTVRQWHPRVDGRLSPYLREKARIPNVVSPIHLIAQSLCEEHVFIHLSDLLII
jgi:hypothetical protein